MPESRASMPDWWVSPEEYLASEQFSEIKHEYVRGRVYELHETRDHPGGTNRHNRIAENLFLALALQLKGTDFRPHIFDTKVRFLDSEGSNFLYPDVVVVGRENAEDETFQDEPILVFEVLSPVTECVELFSKSLEYTGIPTVQAVVFVESEHFGATVHLRTTTGWKSEMIHAAGSELTLPLLTKPLALSEIYEGIRALG